jgi:hypothetical protein
MRWWWTRCPILTTAMTTPASGLVFVIFIFVIWYVFIYDVPGIPLLKEVRGYRYTYILAEQPWHCLTKKLLFYQCSGSVTFWC